MNAHILLVDDEQALLDLLTLYLEGDGFTVHAFSRGSDALQCLETTAIDLAILDVMLPDMSGFDICRSIRQQFFFPIIMLTAKIDDSDKILGLTLGADDYITKPFNPLEVVARVKTQLRRASQYNQQTPATTQEIDIRGLVINRDTHRCFLYNEEISLTPLEFDILWYLASHQGKVVPSEELFEAVWQEKYLKNNNTVMAHIGRLRDKLHEPAKHPKFIKTVWGVGYEIE
ncbi:MAG: VanR-ABDEGLN family response regulator transcription factor [Peptococcaceae bacterium]|nr:VanR-ABDEGLN family response regulator transcription factor [Peptococcaceae bacterium]